MQMEDMGPAQCVSNIRKFTELMGSEAELEAFKVPDDLTDSILSTFTKWLSSEDVCSAKDVVKKAMASFREEVRNLVLGNLKKAADAAEVVQKGDDDGKSWRASLAKEDDLDEMRRVSSKNLRRVDLATKLRDGAAALTEDLRVIAKAPQSWLSLSL